MSLKFRNLDVSPKAPVREWPTEAVLTALERGSLRDWRRLIRVIDDEPWGEVARKVEQALGISRPYGVTGLMQRAIDRARARAAAEERREVARLVRRHLQCSGLIQADFCRAHRHLGKPIVHLPQREGDSVGRAPAAHAAHHHATLTPFVLR